MFTCGIWIIFCMLPHLFFYPWDRRPSSLHIEFVHTGASILTKSLYPKIFPVVSYFMWFSSGYTVVVSFMGYMPAMNYVPMCVDIFFCRISFKVLGCSFECCHMVDYLGAWPGIILVWYVFVHYNVISLRFFHFWDHMGLKFWCIHFLSSIVIFGNFLFFGETVILLLLIGRKKISFFMGSMVIFPLGMPLQ